MGGGGRWERRGEWEDGDGGGKESRGDWNREIGRWEEGEREEGRLEVGG